MSYTAVKLIAPDSLNSFASESSWRNRNVPNKKKSAKQLPENQNSNEMFPTHRHQEKEESVLGL